MYTTRIKIILRFSGMIKVKQVDLFNMLFVHTVPIEPVFTNVLKFDISLPKTL